MKILGESFALKVVYSNVKLPKLNVENKMVEITIPTKYKKMDNSDIIGVLIEKMYDQIAEKEIETSMEKMRVMMGTAPEDFEIKRMKNVLGLCTDEKKICFANFCSFLCFIFYYLSFPLSILFSKIIQIFVR